MCVSLCMNVYGCVCVAVNTTVSVAFAPTQTARPERVDALLMPIVVAAAAAAATAATAASAAVDADTSATVAAGVDVGSAVEVVIFINAL